MHSLMKVFHIFVMCVNKQQQKHSSTTKILKSSNKCVVENILEFHRMATMDLEDEYWESDNINDISWYYFSFRLNYLFGMFFNLLCAF